MSKLLKWSFIFVSSFFLSCSNPQEFNTQILSLEYINVRSGDSLNMGAGIIIRFSASIDLNSFQAQDIITSYEIFYSDSTGPKSYLINQQLYKVIQAENIRVDGQPATLWYHPGTQGAALFEETTIQMPFGTGEGLVIDRDSINIIVKAAIRGQLGERLESDQQIMLYRKAMPQQLRAVPNPAYPLFSARSLQYLWINFFNLTQSCVINIYNQSDLLIRTLTHHGGGSENWDLTYEDGTPIQPGIFRFEIINNQTMVSDGVFVFPAFE